MRPPDKIASSFNSLAGDLIVGNVNYRFRLWHIAFPLTALCLAFLLYFAGGSMRATPGVEMIERMTTFSGGTFEASGLVAVPGSDGVLFVDDGRPGEVFWMRLDESGKQAGSIKAIGLGVEIQDLEGATDDGKHFYVVSSQAKPKAADKEGLVKFKFDAKTQKVEAVESISGLKSFLLENVADLRGMEDVKAKDGGVNIEGIAWDAQRNRWLLGLRSPVINGQALLIPLRLRNAQGAFSLDNLEVVGSKAIRLPLGGAGIRGIEHDGRVNLFRIISGAPEDQDQTDFGLWEWSGDEARPPAPRELNKFDRKLKPEGVARTTIGKNSFTLIVFDASGYTVMD
jgi:hypothetical protein